MNDMRQYMELVALADSADQRKQPTEYLEEGELIPLPNRVLRIPGAPYDFYQVLKLVCNPNLAHKVNYKQTATGKAGANPTDIVMSFYDQVSYEEAKRLFDYYGIIYTDEPELSSELGRQKNKSPYRSKLTPPSQSDEHFGQYFQDEDHPL